MSCTGDVISQVAAVDSDSGQLGTVQYEISPDTDPVTRYYNGPLGTDQYEISRDTDPVTKDRTILITSNNTNNKTRFSLQ